MFRTLFILMIAMGLSQNIIAAEQDYSLYDDNEANSFIQLEPTEELTQEADLAEPDYSYLDITDEEGLSSINSIISI